MVRHTLRTLLLFGLAGAVIAAAAYGAVHATHKKKRHAKVVRDPGRLGPVLFGFNDNSVTFGQTDAETAMHHNTGLGIRFTVLRPDGGESPRSPRDERRDQYDRQRADEDDERGQPRTRVVS